SRRIRTTENTNAPPYFAVSYSAYRTDPRRAAGSAPPFFLDDSGPMGWRECAVGDRNFPPLRPGTDGEGRRGPGVDAGRNAAVVGDRQGAEAVRERDGDRDLGRDLAAAPIGPIELRRCL